MQALKPGINLAGKFRLEELFYEGAFTEAWLVKQDEEYLLVKFYKFDRKIGRERWKKIRQQLALPKLSHPHILTPIHVALYRGIPYVVYPFKSYGPIAKQVGIHNEQELASFFLQAARALDFLYSQKSPIFHGNLHTHNFLIDYNGDYLLMDYRIGAFMRNLLPDDHPGKIEYEAYKSPEYFMEDYEPTEASEVFSLGVTLYEMASGKLPFGERGGRTLAVGEVFPDQIEDLSTRFNQVLRLCLAKRPEQRPDLKMLIRLAERFMERGEWQSIAGFSFAVPEQIQTVRKFPRLTEAVQAVQLEEEKQRSLTIALKGLGALMLATMIGLWILYSFTEEKYPYGGGEPFTQSAPLPVDSLQEFFVVTQGLTADIAVIDSLGGSLTDVDRIYLDQVRTYLKGINKEIINTLEILDADSPTVAGWQEGREKDEWLRVELADIRKYRENVAMIRSRLEE